MSLSQAVANYLNSWEGHSPLEGYAYLQVQEILKQASLQEIINENNTLTRDSLWNEALSALFHDELLDRLESDYTFLISTTWRDLNLWIKNPYFLIWLGFETKYPLIDEYGDLVKANNSNLTSYTLTRESFTEQDSRRILHLLINHEVEIILNPNSNVLDLAAIFSPRSPEDSVIFQPISEFMIRVPATIKETPDFTSAKLIYLGLKKNRPVVVDLFWDEPEDEDFGESQQGYSEKSEPDDSEI